MNGEILMNKRVLRKAVSMTSVFSFLYLTFTGVVMYITPPGRIAYWADWHIFGLNKTMYNETHVTVSMLFIVCMALHIWLNWGSIMNYMSHKSGGFVFFTKETLLGLLLSIAFIAGTLMMVAPFSTVLNALSDYKDEYEYTLGNPPYSHAELTNLEAFIARMKLDKSKAEELLQEAGIEYQMEQTLLDIAKNNKTDPAQVYNVLKPAKMAKTKSTPRKTSRSSNSGLDMSKYDSLTGTGMGNKSVKRIAENLDISIKTALERLKKYNIEASENDKLKEVGAIAGVIPMDVYIIIDSGIKP